MIKLLRAIEKAAWYGIIPTLIIAYGVGWLWDNVWSSDVPYYISQGAHLVSLAMYAAIALSAAAWAIRVLRQPPLEKRIREAAKLQSSRPSVSPSQADHSHAGSV